MDQIFEDALEANTFNVTSTRNVCSFDLVDFVHKRLHKFSNMAGIMYDDTKIDLNDLFMPTLSLIRKYSSKTPLFCSSYNNWVANAAISEKTGWSLAKLHDAFLTIDVDYENEALSQVHFNFGKVTDTYKKSLKRNTTFYVPSSLIDPQSLHTVVDFFKQKTFDSRLEPTFDTDLFRLGCFLKLFGSDIPTNFWNIPLGESMSDFGDLSYIWADFQLANLFCHFSSTEGKLVTRMQHNLFVYLLYKLMHAVIDTSTFNDVFVHKLSGTKRRLYLVDETATKRKLPTTVTTNWIFHLQVVLISALKTLPLSSNELRILHTKTLDNEQQLDVLKTNHGLSYFYKGIAAFVTSQCPTPSNQARIYAEINHVVFAYLRYMTDLPFKDPFDMYGKRIYVKKKTSCIGIILKALFLPFNIPGLHLDFYTARNSDIQKIVKNDSSRRSQLEDGYCYMTPFNYTRLVEESKKAFEEIIQYPCLGLIDTWDELEQVSHSFGTDKSAMERVAAATVYIQLSSGVRIHELFGSTAYIHGLDSSTIQVIGPGKTNICALKKTEEYRVFIENCESTYGDVRNLLQLKSLQGESRTHLHSFMYAIGVLKTEATKLGESLNVTERVLQNSLNVFEFLLFVNFILKLFKQKFVNAESYLAQHMHSWLKENEFYFVSENTVSNVTTHDLRALYATQSHEGDTLQLLHIKKVLGHSASLDSSLRYYRKQVHN